MSTFDLGSRLVCYERYDVWHSAVEKERVKSSGQLVLRLHQLRLGIVPREVGYGDQPCTPYSILVPEHLQGDQNYRFAFPSHPLAC